MALVTSITFLLLYLLGLLVFHAGQAVHVLPVLAVLVLIIDYLLVRRFRER